MIVEKYGSAHLSSYEPVEVTLPSFAVSEDEVWDEMRRIAARHATNVTIEAHPVSADDMVQINIVTKEGLRTFPGLTKERVDVPLGVGYMPLEIETALLGHMPGDVVEAELEYTDYSGVASENEKPADGGCGGSGDEDPGEPEVVQLKARVEILALRKKLTPEVTDEWVAKNIALSNTVDEFAARTERRLVADKRRAYANQVETDVMAEMGKRLLDEVPEELIETVSKQMFREFDAFLKQYDMDRHFYLATQGMTEDDFRVQVEADARERVAQDIALAAYAHHEGIELEDRDIDAMFSQPTPEKTFESRKQAEQTGEIDLFKDLALRAKVTEALTHAAVYRREDGSVDESFKGAVELKYQKIQAVRNHVTSEPMLHPAMVSMKGDAESLL